MRSVLQVAVGILVCGEECWIRRRTGTGHLDGYWEFPGGKLQGAEQPLDGLLREVREETGVRLQKGTTEFLESVVCDYAERAVEIHFFRCHLKSKPRLRGGDWVRISELEDVIMPPANAGTVRRLSSGVL